MLIAAIVFLSLGLINYAVFRPSIILFKWFQIDRAGILNLKYRGISLFFSGYFSDIAWCAALCLVILALDARGYLKTIDKILILLLPFASEAAQYFSLIPGTFDWFDMLSYGVVITIFNILFPLQLIPANMKKIKQHFAGPLVFALLFLMILASAPSGRNTTYHPAPDPCVRHGALFYNPVLVQINIDGNYTMKDLSGAQVSGQNYFFSALQSANPNKYQLAQGVTPNLNIYITINTDGYQHYGATIKFYVYDDNTWFSMPSNYVEPYKLYDDIAGKLNQYVAYGWTHGNCK